LIYFIAMSLPSAATELVLLGAGHAHTEVLRRFAANPVTGARVTVVAREPHSPYAGMLAGLIRGDHDFDAAHIDLRRLARAAGARLLVATADGLDMVNRRISLSGRPALPFDLLSINIGGAPATPEGSGTPAKPIGQILARLAEIEPLLHPQARLAIIGAGAAGTELALALARRLSGQVRVALICADAMPVIDAPARARAAVRDALVDAGVELISGVRAGQFQDGQLALSDGSFLDAVAAIWASDVAVDPFLAAAGLGCDDGGAIQVDEGLRSITHPFVFAAGDCANLRHQPRPKAATWAMMAGPRLSQNLRRAVAGRPPLPWRPRPWHSAAITPVILGLGNGNAIGWHRGLTHAGPSAWRWKLRGDRACMARHEMSPIALPTTLAWTPVLAPMAEATLSAAMDELPRQSPARLPSGASVIQASARMTSFLDDPFVFGQIAAVAALAALPTPGARAWTAIGTVAWPHRAGAGTADLNAMLQGAAGVLAAEGCALTSLRPEPGNVLALNLAVNSMIEAGHSMWAADIRPGDALVLTKPPGAGIVLEADRRGLARARWLHAALAAMRRPNGKAATVLRGHGAICWSGIGPRGLGAALTGLLGPAGLTARLEPENLPALPGARDLAAMGIADPAAIDNRIDLPDCDPITAALLADPQPCGGLLAAVPATHAESCLAALRQAGYAAAIIGQALPPAPAHEAPEMTNSDEAVEDAYGDDAGHMPDYVPAPAPDLVVAGQG
jgi:selenide, water dikinase